MRRLVALVSAAVLVATLAGSSVAAAPSYRVNHVVGNFDVLDWDGSVVGHVVVNYGEPTYERVVPGTLDVTWALDARFPYPQPQYGAKESHTILAAAWFGSDPTRPEQTGNEFIETGADGSMCDFGAPWNYLCHDFGFVIQLNPFGDGKNLVAFGRMDWKNNPAEWYVIGEGAFHVTYTGPTGEQPIPCRFGCKP